MFSRLFKSLLIFFILLGKAVEKTRAIIYQCLFKSAGRGLIFFPSTSDFSYSTISLGENVFIAKYAIFQASESYILIGNKVMFGPRVTIMGGNHNTGVIGKYMYDVKEKRIEDDEPVIIEDDVWVAANVTILKGVTIGKGSIIAAGSLVTHSVPRYSVAGGVPARVLKTRFTPEQIIQHEQLLSGKA